MGQGIKIAQLLLPDTDVQKRGQIYLILYR